MCAEVRVRVLPPHRVAVIDCGLQCKRLKLKCDRKMPCGSCVKREATSKCQYSAAAAEKVCVVVVKGDPHILISPAL